MKLYAMCIDPTPTLFKGNYLVETWCYGDGYGYGMTAQTWEQATHVKVLTGPRNGQQRNFPITVKKERFKPINETHKFRPMEREEKEIEPLYVIQDDINLEFEVGVTKSFVQEHIEIHDFDENDFGHDIIIHKISVENGKLISKDVSRDISFTPNIP